MARPWLISAAYHCRPNEWNHAPIDDGVFVDRPLRVVGSLRVRARHADEAEPQRALGAWSARTRACEGGPSDVEQRNVVRSRPGLDEVGDDLAHHRART